MLVKKKRIIDNENECCNLMQFLMHSTIFLGSAAFKWGNLKTDAMFK